jgi:hypothetical protein
VNSGTIIAIYGSALSTILAARQMIAWRRDRPLVKVKGALAHATLAESEIAAAKGTPVWVKHGHDTLLEEVLVSLTVTNEGERALQIVSVLVESVDERFVSRLEVIPPQLPHVLDPRTSLSLAVQKEHIDNSLAITFIGVVDALGRRHGLDRQTTSRLAERSWELPTRVSAYRRKDDPNNPEKTVRAYAATDRTTLTQRALDTFSRPPQPSATRASLEQPRSPALDLNQP